MWIKGNVSGGWKSRSVKIWITIHWSNSSFSPHLPPPISFLSFFHLFVSFFFLFFLFFFLFFFLSFFLSSVVENTGGGISPREILNDEDFNFNVVEILHPVDRTPFYLQSLENFHSSLSFPTIPLFSFQFSSIEQSLLYRPILNIGFSLMRSWHIKNDIV